MCLLMGVWVCAREREGERDRERTKASLMSVLLQGRMNEVFSLFFALSCYHSPNPLLFKQSFTSETKTAF